MLGMISLHMNLMIPSISAVNAARVAAQSLYSAIQSKPIIDSMNESGKRLNENELIECLELRDVTFYYPSHPQKTIIDYLSITIRRGETLALVGPNGGGKVSYNMCVFPLFYSNPKSHSYIIISVH